MQIIGYEKEKKALNELKLMLMNSKEYLKKGVRIPKGVILNGEPGVGKTRLAKSMAEGLNLIELKAVDIVDDDNISAISEAFEKAKESSPAILLIDEIDKIAGEARKYYKEGNDKAHKVLLQELDNVTSENEILVVATCNDIDSLSDALTRPGRFDRIIDIKLPDFDTRKEILKSYFENLKCEKDFSLKEVAKLTAGESGADLERLVNEVGIYAISSGLKKIELKDIRHCMNNIAFSGFEGKIKEDNSLRNVAIHEAGHAVVGYIINPDGFYGATIIPQGSSNGHMMFVTNETSTYTKKDLLDKAKISLGGHVAERLFIGDYLTGSYSDLHGCAHRIEGMIKDGMFGYEHCILAMGPMFEKNEKVSKLIANVMQEMDLEAEKILKENEDKFMRVVDYLLKDKVVSKETMKEIMEDVTLKEVA